MKPRSSTGRHNPRAPRALKRPFVVLVKRFDPTGEELTRWEPLVRDADGRPEFLSETKAKAAAADPPRDADLHVGDLVTAVPVEFVTDVDNQAHALFVVTPDGVEVAPKVPKELGEGVAWTSAWGQNAQGMLGASPAVDRRRVVLAACDCAETVLHIVPDGEDGPSVALKTARAWCLGGATLDEVRRAANSAASSSTAASTTASTTASSAAAARSAGSAASAILDAILDASDAAHYAATAVAYASPAGLVRVLHHNALRDLAPAVDRWIPLPVILLSRLGYPNAIPFNPSPT